MIRQAISCDICGRDKQQTNHWFVVNEHGAELRISGWNSQTRMSPKAKHLCGQTCLHKLVDDFMARTIAVRNGTPQDEDAIAEQKQTTTFATDTSLTSAAPYIGQVRSLPVATYHDELESSARLIPLNNADGQLESPLPPPRPDYNSRAWRAEAWKREQEREKRSAPAGGRRRSIA